MSQLTCLNYNPKDDLSTYIPKGVYDLYIDRIVYFTAMGFYFDYPPCCIKYFIHQWLFINFFPNIKNYYAYENYDKAKSGYDDFIQLLHYAKNMYVSRNGYSRDIPIDKIDITVLHDLDINAHFTKIYHNSSQARNIFKRTFYHGLITSRSIGKMLCLNCALSIHAYDKKIIKDVYDKSSNKSFSIRTEDKLKPLLKIKSSFIHHHKSLFQKEISNNQSTIYQNHPLYHAEKNRVKLLPAQIRHPVLFNAQQIYDSLTISSNDSLVTLAKTYVHTFYSIEPMFNTITREEIELCRQHEARYQSLVALCIKDKNKKPLNTNLYNMYLSYARRHGIYPKNIIAELMLIKMVWENYCKRYPNDKAVIKHQSNNQTS